MKKKIVFALIIAVIAIVGTGIILSNQQKQTEPKTAKVIRVGYQASSSLTVLEKAKGFLEEEFAKDGVKVEYKLFLAGPPMNEALASGEIDIANMGPLPAISAKGNGINVKAVGRAFSDDFYYGLLVRPDSSIAALQDLKGKKIGIQLGSGAHVFFMFLLQQNGLSEKDFNVVSMPTSDQKAALQAGNVEAIVTWQPFVADVELDKVGKVLISSNGVIKTAGAYLVREDFAKQNPDLVKRFLKVHTQTVDYLNQHADESIKLISEGSKIGIGPLRKSLKTIDWRLDFTNGDIDTLSRIKDLLKKNSKLKSDFDINDFIDKSYL